MVGSLFPVSTLSPGMLRSLTVTTHLISSTDISLSDYPV